MLNACAMAMEMDNSKLSSKLDFSVKHGFGEETKSFIRKNFQTRTCYKYKEKSKDLCSCNRELIEHRDKSNDSKKWSYSNNTVLTPCEKFGLIKFVSYSSVLRESAPKFIRFDCLEDCDATCSSVYQLMTDSSHWNIPAPKLIISINGGLKKMKSISNQHKKNFKQGLIDVIKKDKTWVLGSGLSAGIHRLVSEAIYEFRLHQEDIKDQVSLIGVSTWGTVKNNNQLNRNLNAKIGPNYIFRYEDANDEERGKVTLDALYDTFLFCDDGTEKQYDKEVDFLLKFENFVKKQADGFLVQILFEGGKRALLNAYKALNDKVPLVVMKGSGRVANMISEVMELPLKNYKEGIEIIVMANKITLQISTGPNEDAEIEEFTNYLSEMYSKFQKQIVIYDMMDANVKFDKKILQAMIVGADKSMKRTLKLCIRFNCSNIADKIVFSDPKYDELGLEVIQEMFLYSLKENKPEFVNLFVENNFEMDRFVSEDILKQLYEISFDSEKCLCAELLSDLNRDSKNSCFFKRKNNNTEQNRLFDAGDIIAKLSGNLLINNYRDLVGKNLVSDCENDDFNDDFERDLEFPTNAYTTQDLFLWALLSGRTDLSLILWRIGKDHIVSALVAAIILQRMSELVLIQGDNNLKSKLTDASKNYQDLASSIITQAYNKSKSKTYTLLVRSLSNWDKLTCLQLAINGNIKDFLNHSACRSYTTKIWMGDLSPFLSTWKIIITIPFSLFLMKPIIMPSFPRKGKNPRESVDANNFQNKHLLDENPKSVPLKYEEISFFKAMSIFYRAPIVKFYIHLLSYVVFLMIFAYCNLVELKPKEEIKVFKQVWAEIYLYIYVLTFAIEEIRQVFDQEMKGIKHRCLRYFSGTWNKFDAVIISVFIISAVTRFTITKDYFMICRCLFSICLSMFLIRSMQFYFVNKSIGPKVIMIRDMLRDILFFLSIFVIFVIAYGTLAHSLRFPNSEFNVILFKDIVYSPYFQTFGELMLDNFEVSGPCNGTNCIVKSVTVLMSFAVFLLMTNVLLINLLIAMFGYTFNQIQEDSEKLWCFIRIQLVQEFYGKPIFPPPFNVIYYAFRIISLPCKSRCPKIIFEQDNNLMLKNCSLSENLKLNNFEQFCVNESILESNNNKSDGKDKSNNEIDLFDKTNLKHEAPASNSGQLESVTSFQVRLDHRLEKMEKQLNNIKLN